MKKKSFLKLLQGKLPEDIIIQDTTDFELTVDECVGTLSWIQYFNDHYKQFKKEKLPAIQNPYISERLKLDFGLYNNPSDTGLNNGKHIIYMAKIHPHINKKISSKIDLNKLIIK